jgi:hypothetical protein
MGAMEEKVRAMVEVGVLSGQLENGTGCDACHGPLEEPDGFCGGQRLEAVVRAPYGINVVRQVPGMDLGNVGGVASASVHW